MIYLVFLYIWQPFFLVDKERLGIIFISRFDDPEKKLNGFSDIIQSITPNNYP